MLSTLGTSLQQVCDWSRGIYLGPFWSSSSGPVTVMCTNTRERSPKASWLGPTHLSSIFPLRHNCGWFDHQSYFRRGKSKVKGWRRRKEERRLEVVSHYSLAQDFHWWRVDTDALRTYSNDTRYPVRINNMVQLCPVQFHCSSLIEKLFNCNLNWSAGQSLVFSPCSCIQIVAIWRACNLLLVLHPRSVFSLVNLCYEGGKPGCFGRCVDV